MAYLPPDSVMAAMPIGLLGASHVLVSEAKKPCRTPLATGLHRNRTASDGQKPRLQPFRLRAVCGRDLIKPEAAGKSCGDATFVRNGYQAAGSVCLAAPNQLLILDKSVLSATDMAGVARPCTAPILVLTVSSSRALACRPMASAPSSTARPSSNEKWRAVCQAM